MNNKMKTWIKSTVAAVVAVMALALVAGCNQSNQSNQSNSAPSAHAARPKMTLAVSIYAGWMPWYYAKEEGIIKRWGDKYGVDIDVQYMDYPAGLDAFVAGKADACVMTNMEMLDMPAAAGVDSTAIIMGDYSNGNDAVLVRNGLTLEQLRGQKVYLVEKTVSQYLLSRALKMHTGLKESDLQIVNVSDSDIAPTFLASQNQKVCVTWNPMVLQIMGTKGVSKIFDSSSVPGEIQDLCVVNTRQLKAHPEFARALTGAWYEVMNDMTQPGTADAAIAKMAALAKCSPAEMKAQLATTAMYYKAQAAADYTRSNELKAKQDLVRHFCFEHNLLGEHAASVDVVGISYPDGTIQGNPGNVKFRYDTTYMEEAAAGKLSTK